MENSKKFVTTINCMDGRVQMPINAYLTETYAADYVDTITEAGPIKVLAEGVDPVKLQSIKDRFEVSTQKHDSKVVTIVGHYDCGGNPEPEAVQREQIKASCNLVKTWDQGVEVIGIWVDENWQVNLVDIEEQPLVIKQAAV